MHEFYLFFLGKKKKNVDNKMSLGLIELTPCHTPNSIFSSWEKKNVDGKIESLIQFKV